MPGSFRSHGVRWRLFLLKPDIKKRQLETAARYPGAPQVAGWEAALPLRRPDYRELAGAAARFVPSRSWAGFEIRFVSGSSLPTATTKRRRICRVLAAGWEQKLLMTPALCAHLRRPSGGGDRATMP